MKESMTRRICNNPQLEQDISKNGFAITNLLSPSEFDELQNIVMSINDSQEVNHDDIHVPVTFRLSAFHNDPNYKRDIYDKVYQFLGEKVNSLLNNYHPLVINLFDKLPGAGSVAIHHNPSFVNEPYFKSVSIWIPMIDTNRENGTLGVLPGSHDVFDSVRASNMPETFSEVQDLLTEVYFDPLEIPIGNAVILDDSLIHWSYPNISQERRMTIQLIMVPKEAEHIYYYYNTQNETPKIDMYKVDEEFFFRFNCKEEPVGLPFIGSMDYMYYNLTEPLILDKVGSRNPEVWKRYKKRIAQENTSNSVGKVEANQETCAIPKNNTSLEEGKKKRKFQFINFSSWV